MRKALLIAWENLKAPRGSPIAEATYEFFAARDRAIKAHPIKNGHFENEPALNEKLREINRFGELNLLLSDGTYLFAYHDRSGHVGLHFLLRRAPYKVVRLRGQYLTIDLAEIIDPGIANSTPLIFAAI